MTWATRDDDAAPPAGGDARRADTQEGRSPQPARDANALLTSAAAGDQHAFAALYDLLSPAVHGTARAVLRDPHLAAEVMQEVMLEVWRTAPRFDPGRGSARTFVLTLAHRRAVDRVRAVQAQRDRDQRVADADNHIPFDSVAEEVEDTMERTRVRGCLGSLTETQRDAVVLAYYGGRTYREVAEELGAALPTVKTRIRDGLIRLRDCLGVAS
ncbi:ECF RNA polymerase sigma factor SigK [Actinotalea sp. Marseille-Q4924]|uniref:ECF RNA polymerase sigma factor SigK n=1 Tax=Actinotalea sp. Marseille-Q4924 TaxID=2866571 RepID=UPI001CE44F38|nr:ECF RNA polymerase sigma factor SigK [Actinotalea sp. Marseille-Q4924]